MSIFKACDIRGKYGSDLTAELAELVGKAIGSELVGTFVVGGDVRPSTGPLKEALINGLISAGCHVTDVGILPTPAFYFARDHLQTAGGVMVTGSHNPAGDNGFKISLSDKAITEADIDAIQNRVTGKNFVSGKGTRAQADVIDSYKEFIHNKFKDITKIAPGLAKLKVVIDAGNGCYSKIAPELVREFGVEVIELFCEPDGRFPNRSPNPAVSAHLEVLCRKVLESRADLGVAYDGDGDRVVFVDERGRVVESDCSIVLFARYLLQKTPGEVVYDIKCSSVVADEVLKAGGTPVMEKSGHSYIRATLMAHKAPFGGEISGHFFFGDLGRDDGLYATLLMFQIIASDEQGLATMADSVARHPITPDIRLPCPPALASAIVQKLATNFAQEKECEVKMLDGVRISWRDGWALVRPSVTEPLLTLRMEAHSKERLHELQNIISMRAPELRQLMDKASENHIKSNAIES